MEAFFVSSTTPSSSVLLSRYSVPITGGGVIGVRRSLRKSTYFISRPRPLQSTSSQTMAMASSPKVVEDGGGVDVFQKIKSHQEVVARLPPIEEVKTTLNHSIQCMLSTFSKSHSGYPSGSLIDFATDKNGYPVLSVSSLAVHTKNLLANPKCSLLVAKDPEDRSDLFITLYGDALSVPETERVEIRTAYLKKHPNAFWVDFGDFQFIRIEPKCVSYVSGVATALLRSGEFGQEEYKSATIDPVSLFSKHIAVHMNRDHSEDTKAIVQHSTSVKVEFAHILDLDSIGFNVKAGYQGKTMKLRIPFPRQAENRKDVKNIIVEMLEEAKAS
ncbi:Pyridoxamine 5'-phosphate oxidase-related FMN-binding protein [Zostera marina]|uniref:Pyridoxamine 5'-phosphate oxidase-related FMN-binding protein n=1 Tax=Zostera marina TaxID=29655 RepID=A0A0K9PSN3_ZOSMR|nr:Pyridoxamine 5'-phosphate oxidase-related FMN-binding protein [Zostera marina]